MITIDEIILAAEQVGWNREIEQRNGVYEISFSTDTPCGQDVQYEINVEDLDSVVDEVYGLWQIYDAEEEALLWYGQNKGEPSSIRELLNDMDYVDDMLEELYNELKEIKG